MNKKILLISILCCFHWITSVAQQENNNEWINWNLNLSVSQLLNENESSNILRLTNKDRLQTLSQYTDEQGIYHVRTQQVHNNIPIEEAHYLIHEHPTKGTAMNGLLVRNLNINTVPEISEPDALNQALQTIKSNKYAWQDQKEEQLLQQVQQNNLATYYPKGELIIVNLPQNNRSSAYQLAYRFDIYSLDPMERYYVYINAHNGQFIKKQSRLHDVEEHATINTPPTIASGITHFYGHQSFDIEYDGTTYAMRDVAAEMYNGNSSLNYVNTTNNWTDSTANTVYWCLEKTYDYFLNTHNRNSYDGNSSSIPAIVHYGNQWNNAAWNGTHLLFGDGNSIPYVAADIVAHEWTHGLIEHTANLTYQGESGALNEALCDIFGVIIEDQITTNDWVMGQELGGFRNLSDPKLLGQPNTYQGDYWYQGIWDNGGVHRNSGVMNYWFYLLTEGGNGTNDFGLSYHINGIGMAKSAQIVYKALHDYLTPNSQYIDARIATLKAAENLYGINSLEYQTVIAGWCAVGLGSSTNVQFAFSDTLLTVTFLPSVVDSFLTYNWNFGDGNSSNQVIPTHTYTADSAYEVELIINDVCGQSDTSKQLVIVTNSTSPLAKDSLMLVKLFYDLGGVSNPNNTWNLNNPISTWAGLQSTDSTIISLDLSNQNISTLPNLYLPNLTRLDLSNNQLTELPDLDFPQLLYLAVTHNQLTELPDLDLPNLRYLYLNNNQLTTLSDFNLPNLRYLYAPYNQLTTVPDFNALPLVILHLQNNQLNFDDLTANHFDNLIYGYQSQDSLTIDHIDHLLYVNAGGVLANNIYKWFRNNTLVATITGDSTFAMATSGRYRCEVTNSIFTQNRFFQNLTLYSKVFAVEDCQGVDSIQLKQLYTATNGQNWNNSWDFTQPITTYQGVFFHPSGCGIDSINIRNQNANGHIPNLSFHSLKKLQADQNSITGLANFEYLDSLNYFSITNNQLSDLPNPSHFPSLDTFYVQNNQLLFDDLLPYQNINNFEYAPQDSFTITQLADQLIANVGDVNNNIYYWYKNNTLIATIVNDSILTITEAGYYRVKVQNSILTELDLWSNTFLVNDICDATFSVSQTNICEGSTIFFANQSAVASTYEWSINNTLITTNTNLNHTFNNAGTYEVKLATFSGNCQANYSQTIVVHPNVNNSLAPVDTSICGLPFSKILTARLGMNSYQWTNENGQFLSNSSTYIATQYGNYTITATDFCGNTDHRTVKIIMDTDCNVWAGDCNHDGEVNEIDWLAWGLMFGDIGVSRSDTGIVWEGKICPDWVNIIDGINSKHGDANGDGIVNFVDTAAIVANFGKTISNYRLSQSDWDGNPWRVKTRIVNVDILPNDQIKVTLGIYIQDKKYPNNPVNIHGFASSIKVQTSANQYLGGKSDLSESWLGMGTDLYTMEMNLATQQFNTHQHRLAVTRRDRKNKNGIGILGKVDFIIQEPMTANDTLKLLFSTKNANVSRGQGKLVSLRPVYTALFMVGGTNFNPNIPIEVNTSAASCSEAGIASVRALDNNNTTYTYLWSNGDTSQTITELDTGRYYVTITDALGNTGNGYAEIGGVTALTVSDTITSPSIGQANGAIQLGIQGGSGHYSIQWENGDTSSQQNNLSAGTYLVIVTDDSLGCSVIRPIEVNEADPLPVDLCCFEGLLFDNQVILGWKTLSELNNSHFNIQRSPDGTNFENIGQVNGQGTTQHETAYEFLDNAPLANLNYYRLQQVDYNNQSDYSNIISIETNTNHSEIEIYPNPVKDELTINWGSYGTPQSIEIHNAQGQLVKTINTVKNTISVSELAAGMYFLVIDNQTFIKWIKF